MMKEVKKYEAPTLEVTKIESGDIIMASGTLIDLTKDKLMGKGKIEWSTLTEFSQQSTGESSARAK